MTDAEAETRPAPTLIAAEPQLFVADMAASCAFYTHKLGFAVAVMHGDPPFYGQVFRGGARLNLRCLATPAIDAQRRNREHLLSASITLDDAAPLFREFEAAGVAFHQALRTEAWGARTFIVRDPDGNLILFAGRGASGSARLKQIKVFWFFFSKKNCFLALENATLHRDLRCAAGRDYQEPAF